MKRFLGTSLIYIFGLFVGFELLNALLGKEFTSSDIHAIVDMYLGFCGGYWLSKK